MKQEWQDVETAPLWVEVIVKYSGNRAVKSQPNCIGTAVQTEPGFWKLGSFPSTRNVLKWMPFPED